MLANETNKNMLDFSAQQVKAKRGARAHRAPRGPFAQLRAETSENHTQRRQKKHENAECDVFGLLLGHRFDQQGEKVQNISKSIST